MVGVCIYLNDESADVVVLRYRGTVRLAVAEPGSVVIDLFHFEHYQTTTGLAGCTATAPAVVRSRHVHSV